jgi:hypothetical protein
MLNLVLLVGCAFAARQCTVERSAPVIVSTDNDVVLGYGSWNPFLRSLLRHADDTLSFGLNTADAAAMTNLAASVVSRAPGATAWSKQLPSAMHVTPAINQKDAFILTAAGLRTYAVNWGAPVRAIEECYIMATSACNHLTVAVPPNSNYVGASVCCAGGGQVVWWTTVGVNSAPGTWTYIANYGGGWNGPFVVSLAPSAFNDLAYVSASWRMGSTGHAVGQGIIGAYADCAGVCFRAAVMEIDLTRGAEGVELTVLGDAAKNGQVLSVGDLWVSANGDVHVVAVRIAPVAERLYFFKPASARWSQGHAANPVAVLAIGFAPRFAEANGSLCLHSSSASGVQSHCFELASLRPGAPLNFSTACMFDSPLGADFAWPSGIYVEHASYQLRAPQSLHFMATGPAGSTPRKDNAVIYMDLKVDWIPPSPPTTSAATTTSTAGQTTTAPTTAATTTTTTTTTTTITTSPTSTASSPTTRSSSTDVVVPSSACFNSFSFSLLSFSLQIVANW